MKTASKFILLGLFSLLVGLAFASPLLISELDIVPFWIVPEGPKANLGINVAYANFTIQEPTPRFNVNLGEYNESVFDYSIVLNITNHSNLATKVSDITFAAALEVTVTGSALGGFHGTHEGTLTGGGSGLSSGPAKGYLGHISAGKVEGLWLDGEWANLTWVPEGGLEEIWSSEDVFPPEGLEDIWEPSHPYFPSYLRDDTQPFVPYGGSHSNDTAYYTYSGIKFYKSGGNYWIEGIPLKEYIADNEVKSTIIYFNGSWMDVTGRVTFLERPYLTATNMLFRMGTHFSRTLLENGSFASGVASVATDADSSFFMLPAGFDNTWKPYQSRLILLNGSLDITSLWKDEEFLEEGEITLFVEERNYVNDNIVDGVYVYTISTANELKTIKLELIEDSYIYNTILSNEQPFTTDASGVEVFISKEK